MKVLLAHTYYQQPGGEDAVFEAEQALLRQKGHEVIPFTLHNASLAQRPAWRAALTMIWAGDARKKLERLVRKHRPQIVHFHNTFLAMSPAIYAVARVEGAAVVQTLHNYRLLCPAATFVHNGRTCERCLGRPIPWPGVVRGCWRGQAQTAAVAAMLGTHRALHTWQRQVDVFIALTEFSRRKFVEGGLPPEKIMVKPNFVPDPLHQGETKSLPQEEPYALFVGRLSAEKGILSLLQAWKRLPFPLPLKIIGDGPLRPAVLQQIAALPAVTWLGAQPREAVFRWMQQARFLLFPSVAYETFGRVIVESFAVGTPVLAVWHGSAAELVQDGRTGLLFSPNEADDILARVIWAWEHPAEMAEMGRQARLVYEENYTAEPNYRRLLAVYRQALQFRHGER